MNAAAHRVIRDHLDTAKAVSDMLIADRIVRALEDGNALCIENGIGAPRMADMVWALFEDAASTIRRQPDRERKWLLAGERIGWPQVVYDKQELAENFATQVARIQSGELAMEALELRPSPPTARAIDRADFVATWRRFIVGKNRTRDWKILWLMALRVKKAHICRELRCSRKTLYDRKELQTVAIANGLSAFVRKAAG